MIKQVDGAWFHFCTWRDAVCDGGRRCGARQRLDVGPKGPGFCDLSEAYRHEQDEHEPFMPNTYEEAVEQAQPLRVPLEARRDRIAM